MRVLSAVVPNALIILQVDRRCMQTPVANGENRPTISTEGANVVVANCDDRIAVPFGILLADFKPLPTECDSLRRELATVDAERSQLCDIETDLRINLDDALDRLCVLEGDKSGLEIKVAEKGRALNEATEALRESKICVEEFDSLRVKAQSAEDLDANLRRTNKPL